MGRSRKPALCLPYLKMRPLAREQVLMPALDYLADTVEDEVLTGIVQGKEAYENEERLAMAFDRIRENYVFQFEVPTPQSIPGQGKSIDFILISNMLPIEVDGPFHETESSQQLDAARDAILNNVLKPEGFQDIERVSYVYLETRQHALTLAEELRAK